MKATALMLIAAPIALFILGMALGAGLYRLWVRRKYPEILGNSEMERMIEEQD
jgi:hypothetical protein